MTEVDLRAERKPARGGSGSHTDTQAQAREIAEALRRAPDGRWFTLSPVGGKFREDNLPIGAAQAIEALLAEVVRLQQRDGMLRRCITEHHAHGVLAEVLPGDECPVCAKWLAAGAPTPEPAPPRGGLAAAIDLVEAHKAELEASDEEQSDAPGGGPKE